MLAIDFGTSVSGVDLRSTVNSLFPFITAQASSSRQTFDFTDSGVMTNRKVLAERTPERIASIQGSPLCIRVVSAQVFKPKRRSFAFIASTKGASVREYEMNTSGALPAAMIENRIRILS